MPTVNNNRLSSKKPTKKTVSRMPIVSTRILPLNEQSINSGKAKITKKVGKRLTVKSKNQKTEWLFVPKRGTYVTKNLGKF